MERRGLGTMQVIGQLIRRTLKWPYLGIWLVFAGIGVAALIGVVEEYGKNHWLPSVRWVGLVLFTALLFYTLLGDFRDHWRSAKLWAGLAALLIVHIAAYAWLLTVAEAWGLLWFVPLTLGEYSGATYLLSQWIDDRGPVEIPRRFR
jgi:hypothetical protein